MSCSVFCHVRNFTYLSVAKINKQNSDMTWRRYKLNLRNSLLLEEYFRVMEQFDPTLSSYISAQTAAVRSTMTSLISEAGRQRKSMALSLN